MNVISMELCRTSTTPCLARFMNYDVSVSLYKAPCLLYSVYLLTYVVRFVVSPEEL